MGLADPVYSFVDRVALRRRFLQSSFARSLRQTKEHSCEKRAEGQYATSLQKEGVHCITKHEFENILASNSHRQCFRDVLTTYANGWPCSGQMNLLQPQEVFATQPALYFLGLDDALLDVAEAYLGAPCLYIGPTLKREPVDGKEHGTRKWHIDVEDEHIVRLIIYLTSVTWEDGPFEYVGALERADLPQQGRVQRRLHGRSIASA